MKIISPFRYPGSKRKLLPQIMPELRDLKGISENFTDVFVGGGGVALAVATEYPNTTLYLNDRDPRIAAFWNVTSSDNVSELIDRLDVEPSVDLFKEIRSKKCTTDIDLAVQAFLLNRMAFNGILSATPIGGMKQNGNFKIGSHYNFKKLKELILECNKLLAGRTIVTCKDFREVLSAPMENTAIYLDPPYIMKGTGLYGVDMSNQDHCDLAAILKHRNNWLLSYDDCALSRNLYSSEDISEILVRYCNRNNWCQKKELLITTRGKKRNINKLIVPSVATGVMEILIN